MNAIEKEMQRLAPGYVPTPRQRHQLDTHDDPEGFARILEQRMNDTRDDAVRHLSEAAPDLDITADDITNAEVLPAIHKLKYGGRSGNDEGQMERLGEITLMRIVKRKYDFIGNLYRDHLGRDPDPAGALFWRKTWAEQFVDGIR